MRVQQQAAEVHDHTYIPFRLYVYGQLHGWNWIRPPAWGEENIWQDRGDAAIKVVQSAEPRGQALREVARGGHRKFRGETWLRSREPNPKISKFRRRKVAESAHHPFKFRRPRLPRREVRPLAARILIIYVYHSYIIYVRSRKYRNIVPVWIMIVWKSNGPYIRRIQPPRVVHTPSSDLCGMNPNIITRRVVICTTFKNAVVRNYNYGAVIMYVLMCCTRTS